MYYLSNESIISAIKVLHSSGTHDYFRTYLVLKAHGMVCNSSNYVKVTTSNTNPAVQTLFLVPGLTEEEPFYNPLRNEFLKHDTSRGVIQTHVKKFLDGATKTKMEWMEGYQGEDKAWNIRFSSAYPKGLGTGLIGLADRENVQITIDRPSFTIWFFRNEQWESKPNFDQLWDVVKTKLNLNQIEIDLLFTKNNKFSPDPFIDTEPNRSQLLEFINQEKSRGTGSDVITSPSRPAFSEIKINKIISSQLPKQSNDNWWSATDIENDSLTILSQMKSLLLVGPPGTGKTRLAFILANKMVNNDNTRIHLFQFHASYTYEDFIEALQPIPKDGILKFEPVLKRFAKICKDAETRDQIVILDELNRADVSKVFGEAFMLLENSYRDPKYSIPRLYSPSESFWIPPNLYIIGTLNNLDKSTYDLDFAFRRRFGQVDVLPDVNKLEEILKYNGCADEDFIRILRSVFMEVQIHYPLGHVYFKTVIDRDSLKATYRFVIRPTIHAYLGEYRSEELIKVDNIFKRVFEVSTWEDYINIE
jgi:hypothetical protein